jgi:hypothetical protein
MKRIIFHIGTHKTATTTIQQTLAENCGMLRTHGVLYPMVAGSISPHRRKQFGLSRALKAGDEAVLAERDLLLEEFETSGCETLLLSDEHLSWMNPKFLRRVEWFSGVHQVETICLLRRQDIFLESMWSQLVKGDKKYCENIESYYRRERVRRNLLYDQMLDIWSSFSKVTAVSFEAAKAEGVMRAFSRISGLPFLQERRSYNISPSASCALTLMEINRAELPKDTQQLMHAFQGDTSRHVLGRRLRREILDEVAESNQRLNANYNVHFDAVLPNENEYPVLTPDRQALKQAMVWLCDKEKQCSQACAKERLRAVRRLLVTMYSDLSPHDLN